MVGNKKSSWRDKINNAIDDASNYEWLYYLIVAVILIPFRFGLITVESILIDVIITISIIALSTQAFAKFRNRNKNKSKPYLICTNCNNKIGPPQEWKCSKCGMEYKFPN